MFPRTKWPNTPFGVFVILAMMFLSRQLRADFIPPYDVPTGFIQPFTLSSGSVTPDGSWRLYESGDPLAYTGSLIQTSSSQLFFGTGVSVFRGTFSLDLQFTHLILGTG